MLYQLSYTPIILPETVGNRFCFRHIPIRVVGCAGGLYPPAHQRSSIYSMQNHKLFNNLGNDARADG
ncbi:hypothetical protein, partial [Thalassospira sp. TSL5-1]|uniref:hypothetical protein n=1 Tax=Thalassospira sp. TSL5-1 TaxID=1544451 RepID=UPI001C07AF31